MVYALNVKRQKLKVDQLDQLIYPINRSLNRTRVEFSGAVNSASKLVKKLPFPSISKMILYLVDLNGLAHILE